MQSKNIDSLFIKLQKTIPRRPFVPNVVDIASAVICPRNVLLRLVYGASGENNAGLAIGIVAHSVLAELGRIETSLTQDVDASIPLEDIAHQIYERWLEVANKKIEDSWRVFADAQISVEEGRNAVLQRLHSFSNHLASEIQLGYQRPDNIVTSHHIINLDLPLEGVPDEYRIYNDPLHIEIREFKSYGGSKVTETNKLQACGYRLLLEQIYPNADFTIKVISPDKIVYVRMTDSRRQRLHQGIEIVQKIYESARGSANKIPKICNICYIKDACQYYFQDNKPAHIRRYFWRLRMETLEEKGLNQVWKWKSKLLPLDVRIQLGFSDGDYKINDMQPNSIQLSKIDYVNNILPGDTVIVSGGNPLTTPSFTGEVSKIHKNSLNISPYGDVPLGLQTENLTIDHYNVDMTRRQLKSIDTIHRSHGRVSELNNRILGIDKPAVSSSIINLTFSGDLNENQRQAITLAIRSPDFSVILGPPGTGKTAVIVELLIQLVHQKKRALVVSITNTAVDNIVERLLDQGHKFGVRFGNWYKIRDRPKQVALINIITNEADLALAAVEKMRTVSAVLTTCSSASLDLVKAGQFDIVIFEESSQIRMQDAFTALSQAEKAIIIGDDKQLPPVSKLHRPISSLLEIAINTIKRYDLTKELIIALHLQYRMQKQICELINRSFYDGALISSPIIEKRPHLDRPTKSTGHSQLDTILDPGVTISIIDVEGVEEFRGSSILNRINLEVDSLLINSLRSAGLTSDQIGLITPYKEQQRLLASRISDQADIGTVDSFQGQERDVVILDLVRANPHNEVGFTLDANRLNVALSRARYKLIIVTNLQTFKKHSQFNQILNLIRSLANTRLEHITAKELSLELPEYKKRMEVKITPNMVDKINEPEPQTLTESTEEKNYFDIF